jgi:hypothetical protein
LSTETAEIFSGFSSFAAIKPVSSKIGYLA